MWQKHARSSPENGKGSILQNLVLDTNAAYSVRTNAATLSQLKINTHLSTICLQRRILHGVAIKALKGWLWETTWRTKGYTRQISNSVVLPIKGNWRCHPTKQSTWLRIERVERISNTVGLLALIDSHVPQLRGTDQREREPCFPRVPGMPDSSFHADLTGLIIYQTS